MCASRLTMTGRSRRSLLWLHVRMPTGTSFRGRATHAEKHDTYEPEKNLAGAKRLLEDFHTGRAEEASANAEVTKAKHDSDAALHVEKQRDEREVTRISTYNVMC